MISSSRDIQMSKMIGIARYYLITYDLFLHAPCADRRLLFASVRRRLLEWVLKCLEVVCDVELGFSDSLKVLDRCTFSNLDQSETLLEVNIKNSLMIYVSCSKVP